MKTILSFILHHANRNTKNPEFYAIKDLILKKHGTQIGYDIQHLDGNKCWTCNGSGQYERYSQYPPYKAYDWEPCNRCFGSGWYRLPAWVCLARIQFGKYIFHRPLKREFCVKNPFTVEEMGFEVFTTPVIEGYIDHDESWFGPYAVLILYAIYNHEAFRKEWIEFKKIHYWRTIYKFRKFKHFFTWDGFVLEKPHRFINHWMNANGEFETIDPDLPF